MLGSISKELTVRPKTSLPAILPEGPFVYCHFYKVPDVTPSSISQTLETTLQAQALLNEITQPHFPDREWGIFINGLGFDLKLQAPVTQTDYMCSTLKELAKYISTHQAVYANEERVEEEHTAWHITERNGLYHVTHDPTEKNVLSWEEYERLRNAFFRHGVEKFVGMFTFSYAAREKGRCFPFLSAFNISDIPASKTCVTWLETAKDDLMQSLGRSSAQLPERLSEKLFCGVKMWCKMSVASRRLFWGP